MFSVEWSSGGRSVGHTLFATRGFGGAVKIVDRSGRVVSNLSELNGLYNGISSATVYGSGAIINNSRIVTLLNNAPTLLNLLALEVRAIPVPPAAGGQSAPVVLRSNKEYLCGFWTVRVANFLWVYVFETTNVVRWIDPYNHKTGRGKWSEKPGMIDLVWDSGVKESWYVTANYVTTNAMTGSYFAKGKDPIDVNASKIPRELIAAVTGKWTVNVDKYVWEYKFDGNGYVRWTDIYSKETGLGTWWPTANSIFISWAPTSGTREDWTLPLRDVDQPIDYRASYGTFKFPQAKARKDG
jgi:hypothetical protein